MAAGLRLTMRVRAAVSDQAQPDAGGVVHTTNSPSMHAVDGLRVRHAHKHDAAQQHGSHQQSCAEPPFTSVRTPAVQDLDVLGAARAAPGVLAVVSCSIHFSCCYLLLARGRVCEGSGLQLTVLCGLGSWKCVPRFS